MPLLAQANMRKGSIFRGEARGAKVMFIIFLTDYFVIYFDCSVDL